MKATYCNLELLVFVEGEKPEVRVEKLSEQVDNQQQHETASTGIEPESQRWEASGYPTADTL